MREYKAGIRCEECGQPIPSRNVLGGGLCDECWDAITARRWEEEVVELVDDEPSGQAFPDECPGCRHGVCAAPTPAEQRLERWTSALLPAPF